MQWITGVRLPIAPSSGAGGGRGFEFDFRGIPGDVTNSSYGSLMWQEVTRLSARTGLVGRSGRACVISAAPSRAGACL